MQDLRRIGGGALCPGKLGGAPRSIKSGGGVPRQSGGGATSPRRFGGGAVVSRREGFKRFRPVRDTWVSYRKKKKHIRRSYNPIEA